jgi:hypothetical protein
MRKCIAICAAVAFKLCGAVRILLQVLGRHAVVMPFDRVAQAAKEAIHYVCMIIAEARQSRSISCGLLIACSQEAKSGIHISP